MCGICGEYSFGGQPVEALHLEQMRDSLVHRGPDDAGSYVQGPIGLGHRRLSIIDLSPLGRQPLWSADGSTAITFNGEIYNYQPIRAELEGRGVAFRGGSDTEVAVNAVAELGVDAALDRFIGMFAMGIWSERDRTLTLCRDRVGIKPLYYSVSGGRVLFASEMRAFLAHPSFRPETDRESLGRYLTCGYFAGRETVFRSVRKVLPGHYVTIGPDGAVREQRYWSIDRIERGSFRGSCEEACESVMDLLRDSFRLRLVSDVPVGHFLSGGVDSSLVSAVVTRDCGVDLTHFTIGFREQAYDEVDAAQAVARSLGVRHLMHYVAPDEAQETLAIFCNIFDEPIGDPSGIPTSILSNFARGEVKVALSADGGDEQFCGYTGHVRYPALFQRFRGLPGPVRKGMAACLRALPYQRLLTSPLLAPLLDGRKPHGVARFEKLLQVLAAESPADVLDLYAHRQFSSREAATLLGLPESTPVHASSWGAAASSGDLVDQLMRHDYAAWLPDDILLKVDRASMHASLECRDPLLDHRIGELAFSLPISYLARDGEQKHVLKRLLRRYVGPEVVDRPKRGFDIPLYRWLKGPWRPFLEGYASRERLLATGILDPGPASREVELFLSTEGRDPSRIWLILNLQMWAERWLAPRSTGSQP